MNITVFGSTGGTGRQIGPEAGLAPGFPRSLGLLPAPTWPLLSVHWIWRA